MRSMIIAAASAALLVSAASAQAQSQQAEPQQPQAQQPQKGQAGGAPMVRSGGACGFGLMSSSATAWQLEQRE